jgi:hypothetical protein
MGLEAVYLTSTPLSCGVCACRFNHELLYKCILAQAVEALGSSSMRSAAAAGPIHLHLRH